MTKADVKYALETLFWTKVEAACYAEAAEYNNRRYFHEVCSFFLKLERETVQRAAYIEAWLDLITDPTVKEVLYLRYAENKTVESIADALNFSTQNIYRLQGKGISQLAKLLEVTQNRQRQTTEPLP